LAESNAVVTAWATTRPLRRLTSWYAASDFSSSGFRNTDVILTHVGSRWVLGASCYVLGAGARCSVLGARCSVLRAGTPVLGASAFVLLRLVPSALISASRTRQRRSLTFQINDQGCCLLGVSLGPS